MGGVETGEGGGDREMKGCVRQVAENMSSFSQK